MNTIEKAPYLQTSDEIREAVSRASGTIIRNLEVLYSKEYPFDLARKNVLDALGARGLLREIAIIVGESVEGGSK